MLAFLLGTKTGHALIALALMLMAGGLCYWRGHNRGWDSATAHYTAVVNSCLAANQRNERTIAELQTANQQWADATKADVAKLAQAVAQVEAEKAADAKALAAAQAKLHEVEHAQGDAHAWSVTPVPPGVLNALGLRSADRSH
jgi:predicted negative regulator of RcsB-dependent stress response